MTNGRLWKLSYLDGWFFSIMVATSESYFLYYLGKKGITGLKLGLLSTFPIFLASISLLVFPKIHFFKKNDHSLIISQLIQAFGLFLILIFTKYNLSISIALLGLISYWIGGQMAGPIWLDFISSHTQRNEFGNFLSKRNTFVTFSTLISFLVLSYFIKSDSSYSLLFFIGLMARIFSTILNFYLIKKYPSQVCESEKLAEQGEAAEVLKQFHLWGAIFRFSVAIASPFFLTFMVNDLKLSPSSYVWLSASPLLARALFQKNWAKASEHGKAFYGFQISTVFISTLPILWTFSSNYFYLIFLQLLSGLFWGGIELTQVLMIQNYFHGNSRQLFAKQQAFFGLAATIGSIVGGLLYDQGHDLFQIFNLSTIFRFLLAIIIIFQVRKFELAKLSLSLSTRYLVTLLSIRGSLAFVMRTIPIKRREK